MPGAILHFRRTKPKKGKGPLTGQTPIDARASQTPRGNQTDTKEIVNPVKLEYTVLLNGDELRITGRPQSKFASGEADLSSGSAREKGSGDTTSSKWVLSREGLKRFINAAKQLGDNEVPRDQVAPGDKVIHGLLGGVKEAYEEEELDAATGKYVRSRNPWAVSTAGLNFDRLLAKVENASDRQLSKLQDLAFKLYGQSLIPAEDVPTNERYWESNHPADKLVSAYHRRQNTGHWSRRKSVIE